MLLVVAFLLLFGTPAGASPPQSATAKIQGVVHDSSGAVLPGVTVVLTNLDTGAIRRTSSLADGTYRFLAVAIGHYRLQLSHAGFESAERRLELTADDQTDFRIALAVARQSQAVEVISTDQPLVEPARTSLGRTILPREINDLPVPAGLVRDINALAPLTPGVIPDSTGLGIATAGQGAGDNTYMLDGLSVDSALASGQTGNLPLDAIREFRVVSNHVSAEFGQASGVVVNVVTRSGTNTPAARGYYLQQNGAWNATSAAAARVGATDADLDQITGGGFWGGPIVRNRAFAFGAAEQVVQRSTYVNTSPAAAIFRPADPLSLPIETRGPKVFGRFDLNLRPSNALTVRYSRQARRSADNLREDLSAAERGQSQYNPMWNAGILDTQVLGSSMVNELRLQWGQARSDSRVDTFCPGCAALNYTNLILLGKPPTAPQVNNGRRTEAADVLSWMTDGRTGQHVLKVGLDLSAVEQHGTIGQNRVGTYAFATATLPFDAADSATYPSRFTQSLGDPDFRVRETTVAVFGEDAWQPRDGLTVNAGVRWDHVNWPGQTDRLDGVAPRVGVAFDPWKHGTTAIRAAAGRYYNESFLPISRDAELGLTQITIQAPGYQGSLTNFDPYGPNPNRKGPAVAQISINGRADMALPYTDQASVGVQHQFGRNLGVSADVVRALGHNLPIGWDLNYPDPVTHARPDPTLQQLIVTAPYGESWYTGLQVGVRKPLSHHYAYTIAYTLSSTENDTDGVRVFPQDQNNLLSDRGPSANDARHRLTASWTLDLPAHFGLSGIVSTRSGLPYNVTTGAVNNNTGMLTVRQAGVGRNSARGTAAFDADVRFWKTFSVGQSRLQLLVEMFNVTNQANWTGFQGNTSKATFGQPASSGPPRQLQIGARFDF
ncbi:MAG TPA: TonB-dependent receptor [Vicinamibacterales bacterium]|nr:TonB-dependent receptor [Vicinamibacterales bacterium]